jgi:N-acetylglucosaminyldiphosphoundecaprenol N-acetyl-beta-D-mannosaminyltransferase
MEKILTANIPVHLFTVETLHQTIKNCIEGKSKTLFLHANANLIELANHKEKWLVDFFNKSGTYVMCDGAGVQLAARITHQPIPEKIPYNIWIWDFIKFVASHRFRVFFLGSDQENISKAVSNLRKYEPSLIIAGYHHGYFEKNTNSVQNQEILRFIKDAKADIILVGFGMPIQEKWVKENQENIDCNTIFTCGGAFDFISGKNSVAPYIFRKLYLEWLYRFMLEPIRLFGRAFISNLRFLKIIFFK